jgi:hypothetical protein
MQGIGPFPKAATDSIGMQSELARTHAQLLSVRPIRARITFYGIMTSGCRFCLQELHAGQRGVIKENSDRGIHPFFEE